MKRWNMFYERYMGIDNFSIPIDNEYSKFYAIITGNVVEFAGGNIVQKDKDQVAEDEEGTYKLKSKI